MGPSVSAMTIPFPGIMTGAPGSASGCRSRITKKSPTGSRRPWTASPRPSKDVDRGEPANGAMGGSASSRLSGFYRRFLGLDRIPTDLDTWMVLPENSLAACTNGKVFRDPLGEFTEWREALLAFYPEDVRRKKIAARCMTIGQAGQYNFPRCVQRGELFAARYAETKFCADVISVVFLLNRRYTPFYKWMHRAVGDLPLLGAWIRDRISDLITESDFARKEERIEEICATLIQEFGRQMLSSHDSTFLPDHGPVIQATIQDASLRGRNVWVG